MLRKMKAATAILFHFLYRHETAEPISVGPGGAKGMCWIVFFHLGLSHIRKQMLSKFV